MLLVRAFYGIVGVIFIRAWLTTSFLNYNFKELLSFGIPYGIICTIDAFLPAMDRFFITLGLTEYELGIYAVGYKIALIQFAISAFELAWVPFYLSLFKTDNVRKTYNSVCILYTAVLCMLLLCITIFGDSIINILATSKFNDADLVIFPLALAFVLNGIGFVLSIGIDLSKKSYLRIYGYILRLVVTTVCIFSLIKGYGILGVAVAVLIGHLSNVVFQTYYAFQVSQIRFDLLSVLGLLILTSVLSFAAHALESTNDLLDITKNVGFILFELVLIWQLFIKNKIKVINLKEEKNE